MGGGSADDSTTAPSAGGLGLGSREARVGAAVLAASEVLAVTDAAVLLVATENNGIPASAAGRGIAPKGEPAVGPTHQVGDEGALSHNIYIPSSGNKPKTIGGALPAASMELPCRGGNCLHPLLVRAPAAARSVCWGVASYHNCHRSACWT